MNHQRHQVYRSKNKKNQYVSWVVILNLPVLSAVTGTGALATALF